MAKLLERSRAPEKKQEPVVQPPVEDRIRTRAYEIYLERNDAPGDAVSDWYQAVEEISGRRIEPGD